MDDLISRSAALDAIYESANDLQDVLIPAYYRDLIKELPTIQSEAKVEFHDKDHVWIDGKQYISLRRFQEAIKEAQPKEGHWIEGGIYRDIIECYCSECGQLMTTAATVRMSYCPRCGAHMKEGENNG